MFKGSYIAFEGYSIKQHDTVENLNFQLDSKLISKALAWKIIRKRTTKLKFHYQKRRYLILALTKLLYDAVIQLHFNCGCSSWFPALKKNLKIKLRKAQNKYIRFCRNLPPRSRINQLHIRKIKRRPARDRVVHCFVNIVFKYRTNIEQIRLSFFRPKIWSGMHPIKIDIIINSLINSVIIFLFVISFRLSCSS